MVLEEEREESQDWELNTINPDNTQYHVPNQPHSPTYEAQHEVDGDDVDPDSECVWHLTIKHGQSANKKLIKFFLFLFIRL